MRHLPTAVCAVLVASLGVALISPEKLQTSLHEWQAASASRPARELPGVPPALLLLDIHGPASMKENSGARFSLVARYSDDTSGDVTERAEWSVDSPHAAVARGVFRAFEVRRDERVTVTAWFTDGLSLKASRTLTIENLPEASGLADAPPASRFPGTLRAPTSGPRPTGAEG